MINVINIYSMLSKLSSRTLLSEHCLLHRSKVLSKCHHPKTALVILQGYCVKNNRNSSSYNCQYFKNSFGFTKLCRNRIPLPSNYVQIRFYSLPSYTKIVLPALSPTMETGTIVQWQVKEGDHFEPGDLLADIETDKATMGFEAIDEGYIAKILVKEGSKDVPLGTLVAISVENEEDIQAFKNISAEELNVDQPQQTTSNTKTPPASQTKASAHIPDKTFPSHDRVLLPALSPTMTTGTIIAWEKQEGDKIEEGDPIATIETDKASMSMEYQDEGYLAKILVKEGVKDLPLGTPLCIVVSSQEDISAFSDYVDSGTVSPPVTPTLNFKPPDQKQETLLPPPTPPSQPMAKQSGDRLFISPFAKKLAGEKGINLQQLTGLGTGPGGRIRAQDLDKVYEAATQHTVAPPTPASPVLPSSPVDKDYIDIPLTNIRKVIAKRLLESKQTVPHYYLTVDITMDKVLDIRKIFNSDLQTEDVKLSVNDFIIKAAALACLKVPQANSSWQDTFIRQFNTVDMSVAVSTDSGLITPILFDAHAKGLVSISKDVITLANKAREGKLQPQEFQGGTFTISNLGMFGVKHFTAIINPPQSCILAVGSARKEFVPESDAEDGTKVATVMSVTLSCDHRVVDGAVGAQWLQHFKKFLEDPVKMLL